MAIKRTLFTLIVVENFIYAIGGISNEAVLSSVERYDANLNRWTPVQSMIVPRSSAAAAVLKNELFVVGGATELNSNGSAFSETTTVEYFNGKSWMMVSFEN